MKHISNPPPFPSFPPLQYSTISLHHFTPPPPGFSPPLSTPFPSHLPSSYFPVSYASNRSTYHDPAFFGDFRPVEAAGPHTPRKPPKRGFRKRRGSRDSLVWQFRNQSSVFGIGIYIHGHGHIRFFKFFVFLLFSIAIAIVCSRFPPPHGFVLLAHTPRTSKKKFSTFSFKLKIFIFLFPPFVFFTQ